MHLVPLVFRDHRGDGTNGRRSRSVDHRRTEWISQDASQHFHRLPQSHFLRQVGKENAQDVVSLNEQKCMESERLGSGNKGEAPVKKKKSRIETPNKGVSDFHGTLGWDVGTRSADKCTRTTDGYSWPVGSQFCDGMDPIPSRLKPPNSATSPVLTNTRPKYLRLPRPPQQRRSNSTGTPMEAKDMEHMRLLT